MSTRSEPDEASPPAPRRGWSRLSTGLKMLIILSAGLLPLGLIAMFASIESARHNDERREAETTSRVETKAERIYWSLSRNAITLRAASDALRMRENGPNCRFLVQRLVSLQIAAGRYALFGSGDVPACTTPGYAPSPGLTRYQGRGSNIRMAPDGSHLEMAVFDSQGRIQGVAQLPRSRLEQLSHIPGTTRTFDLELAGNGGTMMLHDGYDDGLLTRTRRAEADIAGGRLTLRMRLADAPVTLVELMMMALPLVMWAGAAVIGWFLINWLILKPLAGVQRAVSAYQPGDPEFSMPRIRTPSREIGDLGAAFHRVTRTVAQHEADLEAAVERQRKLVREVHHRVKNNLQVVASLLNLHARGAKNDDVAAAYASIQRRVDALAVVHRNHYAELEENRGVALRSLISELGANLRATAPASAAGTMIRLDVEPVYVTQDVAVSVAFLITEIVEYAMLCGGASVTITLAPSKPGLARLAMISDSLRGDAPCDEMLTDRFSRIVTGLSRQLRSAVDIDEAQGRYALHIAILAVDEQG